MKKILAILLAGLMIFSLCACEKGSGGGSGGKSGSNTSFGVIEEYCRAVKAGDGKALFSVFVDPYSLEQLINTEMYDDKEDVLDWYEDEAEETLEALEEQFGENIKIEVEKKRITEYDDDEVDKINKYLADVNNYPEDYISELEVVKVKGTIEGDDDSDSKFVEYVAVKIDGRWYIAQHIPGLYGKDSIREILDKY